jgi:hypothetical protein
VDERSAVPDARKHAGKGTQHSEIPPKRKLLMATIFETDLNLNVHVPTESLHTGKIVAVLYRIKHYAIKTCGWEVDNYRDNQYFVTIT